MIQERQSSKIKYYIVKISDLFQCANGAFINLNKVCDAENDCASGEDEENCGIAEYPSNDTNNENVAVFTPIGMS